MQNRVTPFGEIVALSGRGLLMGNRGILHDESRRIIRSWQGKRWIACLLEYKGNHREVMTPHTWTELFFLDEATALSAGHRPCAECRRGDYQHFRSLWETGHGGPASANAIDEVLHRERLDWRKKRTYCDKIAALPDGAFIAIDGNAWLVYGSQIYAWSDTGYAQRRARSQYAEVEVLTPGSIVRVLEAGYRPMLHPSVAACNG